MPNSISKSSLKPERVHTVDKKHIIREGVIRAAWKERGRMLWNPKIHRKGIPLIIPEKQTGTSTATVLPSDTLEFRFYRARGPIQPFNYIVCEGIVVETWGQHESPPFIIVPG
jgi:hypothetical protein